MGRIKRIAILVPSLEHGGMERVAAELSEMLIRENYEVYIFVKIFNKRKAYTFGGKVVIFPYEIDITTKQNEFVSYYISSLILKDIKRRYAIEATISFAPEMNFLNLLSGTGDRKILTIHNCTSLRDEIKSVAYTKPVMYLSNLAYKVVAVCQWCREDLRKHYCIRSKKLEVIYNPSFMRYIENVDEKECIVFTAGRLEDVKQQWHIVKAFKYVVDKVPQAQLWIAGEGPNRKKLEVLVEHLGMSSNVKFLGFVRDMSMYYSKAKVFVMASKSEAFPCVAIEALAHGVPIVASDFPGGIRECMGDSCETNFGVYPIEMKAGILTTNHFVEEPYLAQICGAEVEMGIAIQRLLCDEELYKEKVKGCKAVIKKFNYKSILKQWTELLSN